MSDLSQCPDCGRHCQVSQATNGAFFILCPNVCREADALMFRFFREDKIEPRWRRRGAYMLVRLNSRLRGDDWK